MAREVITQGMVIMEATEARMAITGVDITAVGETTGTLATVITGIRPTEVITLTTEGRSTGVIGETMAGRVTGATTRAEDTRRSGTGIRPLEIRNIGAAMGRTTGRTITGPTKVGGERIRMEVMAIKDGEATGTTRGGTTPDTETIGVFTAVMACTEGGGTFGGNGIGLYFCLFCHYLVLIVIYCLKPKLHKKNYSHL